MESNESFIHVRIALLVVGFFLQKLNTEEQTELDNWIADSMENQRLFESFLGMAARPVRPIDEDGLSEDFRYIADLYMKKIKHSITPDELAIQKCGSEQPTLTNCF